MRAIRQAVWITWLCCAMALPAWAQPDVPGDGWGHGTTLDGFAGVAIDSSRSGALLGGAVGWEVTPRVAIEGSGAWLEFGGGSSAFNGALKMRLRLSGLRTIDPFVQAGVGLYRASFTANPDDAPGFYSRRMSTHMEAGVGATFTDPTVVAGGGVNVFLTRQFSIRPDVEAAIVLRDRRSLVVTSVTLHAVYHFEDRPVTPSRRR